jgi:hypothetical protein
VVAPSFLTAEGALPGSMATIEGLGLDGGFAVVHWIEAAA